MRLFVLSPWLAAALVAAPASAAPAKARDTSFAAHQAFLAVLDAVNARWFGQAYQGITSVQVQGSLGITLSGAAVNRKVDQLSRGQLQSHSQGGQANLQLAGTYFADGDFRTNLTGDFGNLLYARRGDRGFLYSKDLNAYTTRVDLPDADAPLTWMSWFQQVINEIKAVYVTGNTFKARLAGDESVGGHTLQRIVFDAPTSPWDAQRREQSMAQSLGFWKRGHLEILADKTTHMPERMDFRNEEQGVHTRMDFTYGNGDHLQAVTVTNRSRGFEGPGWLHVAYGADGRMSHVDGELSSKDKRISFSLSLSWSSRLTVADIAALPPAGAARRGKEELETQLGISLAGQIFNLQRQGLNLRSVSVSPQ